MLDRFDVILFDADRTLYDTGAMEVRALETLQNMGRIADPGMRETERTIVELIEQK